MKRNNNEPHLSDPVLRMRIRIRDPVLYYLPDQGSGSGMEQWTDTEPGSGISKQNWLIACVIKVVGSGIRCFFTPRIRDPGYGYGMEQLLDPDPGSGIKHAGSATLIDHNYVVYLTGIVS
jgi:hypothetical protein